MPWARSRSSLERRPARRCAARRASRRRVAGSSSTSCPWPARASPPGRPGAAGRRRAGCARSGGATRRRRRRCGPGRPAAPRCAACSSSRLACSAESSRTLCRARPTWRASSASTRSSSSVNGSPSSAGRSTTMRPSSSPRWATGATRTLRSPRPSSSAGQPHLQPGVARTRGPGDDRLLLLGRARAWAAPGRAPTPPARVSAGPGPDLGRRQCIVLRSDSASCSSSSSIGTARDIRPPKVRSASSGAWRSP